MPLSDYRFPGDLAVFHALNALPAPLARALSVTSGRLFDGGCIALAAVLIAWRTWPSCLAPLAAATAAISVTDLLGARILKPLFHRLRPCDVLAPGSFHPWLAASRGGSLPSLHAANAFVLAWVVARLVPRSWPWVYAVATLVALSRPVGGVHWPSDIGAGALFGTAVGALATTLLERASRRPRAAPESPPVAAP